MSRIPGDPGGDEQVVYPLDHMREVAAKILVQASDAQAQHDQQWQQIQTYITHDFDPGWGHTVLACVQPYAQRVRATYDWQINLASALFDAIDAIEGNENGTTQSFTPRRGPQPV